MAATYEFAGKTHHIVVVVNDQGHASLYIDGELHTQEFAIYDKQLTVSEVFAHAAAYIEARERKEEPPTV